MQWALQPSHARIVDQNVAAPMCIQYTPSEGLNLFRLRQITDVRFGMAAGIGNFRGNRIQLTLITRR